MAEFIWSNHVSPETFTIVENNTATTSPITIPTTIKSSFPNIINNDGELTASTAPNVIFSTRQELIDHYKSDYHRYNLKQKLQEQELISLEEFEQLLIDANFR